MLRSLVAAALLCCAAAPFSPSASAQLLVQSDTRVPRLRVTPFAGYFTPLTRQEVWSYPADADYAYADVAMSIGGGPAGGLQLEAVMISHFGVTLAGGYAARGPSRFVVSQSGTARSLDGSDILFARAGLAFHLPMETADLVARPVGASLHAGAALMREQPGDRYGLGSVLQQATHYGATVGFSAERAFAANRLAFQVGADDHMIWWDERALASVPYVFFGAPGGSPEFTTATAGMSHAWMLRAGLSFRF